MSAREVCDQERLFHPSKYRGEIPRDEQEIMVTALSADRFSFLFFKISKVLQKIGAVPKKIQILNFTPCMQYTLIHIHTNYPLRKYRF